MFVWLIVIFALCEKFVTMVYCLEMSAFVASYIIGILVAFISFVVNVAMLLDSYLTYKLRMNGESLAMWCNNHIINPDNSVNKNFFFSRIVLVKSTVVTLSFAADRYEKL